MTAASPFIEAEMDTIGIATRDDCQIAARLRADFASPAITETVKMCVSPGKHERNA